MPQNIWNNQIHVAWQMWYYHRQCRTASVSCRNLLRWEARMSTHPVALKVEQILMTFYRRAGTSNPHWSSRNSCGGPTNWDTHALCIMKSHNTPPPCESCLSGEYWWTAGFDLLWLKWDHFWLLTISTYYTKMWKSLGHWEEITWWWLWASA